MLLLDTDVVIDVQRGFGPAVQWFGRLQELPAISGVVLMELIQDARNLPELHRTMKMLEPLPLVWPTEQDCSRALAELKAHHLSQGLGVLDALIACCAIGRGASLCTFNIKHYRCIDGLQLVQPYEK